MINVYFWSMCFVFNRFYLKHHPSCLKWYIAFEWFDVIHFFRAIWCDTSPSSDLVWYVTFERFEVIRCLWVILIECAIFVHVVMTFLYICDAFCQRLVVQVFTCVRTRCLVFFFGVSFCFMRLGASLYRRSLSPLRFWGAFLICEMRCLFFHRRTLSPLHFWGVFLIYEMQCLFFHQWSLSPLCFWSAFLICETWCLFFHQRSLSCTKVEPMSEGFDSVPLLMASLFDAKALV
jgi:hypothetical protein